MGKIYKDKKELSEALRIAGTQWQSVVFVIILFLIINVGVGLCISTGVFGPKLATGIEKAVVKIIAEGRSGTGFFVAKKFVLTAAHVAGDVGQKIYLEDTSKRQFNGEVVVSGYPEWKKFRTGEGTVKKGGTRHDWALVKIDDNLDDPTVLNLGTKNDSEQGATVYMAGHPHAQALTVSKGIISRIEDIAIYTDGAIDKGFSGGPMIMVEENQKPEDGVVVGIMVSVPEGMTTVNTALLIDVAVQKCSESGFDLIN